MELQVVLVTALVVAVVAVAWAVAANERSDNRRSDQANAGALESAVEALTGQAGARVLDTAAALNGLSPRERRRRFDRIARLILSDPAIGSVVFLQRVADRDTYQRTRAPIRTVSGDPPPKSGALFVVDQRLTKLKDAKRLGVDLYSDPVRQPFIKRAIDRGEVISTPPIRLLSGAFGTSIFVPVYRNDMPTQTPAQRRAATLGLVNATMRTATIVSAIKELAPQLDGFRISDGKTAIVRVGRVGRYGPSRSVEMFGRRWDVMAAAARSTVAVRLIIVVLVGALLIGLIILAFIQARRRERYAQRMVERRTRELATERHQMAMAQKIAGLGSWSAELPAGEVIWSDEVYSLFGVRREQGPFHPDRWSELIDADDRESVQSAVEDAIRSGGDFEIEFLRITPDDEGQAVHLVTHGFVEATEDDSPLRLIGTIADVSERRRREQDLRHQADHDQLTGLANRRGFERALRAHLADQRRSGSGSLLLLDLDGLKEINDARGHAAGDALLVSTAKRLAASMRTGDVSARIGGDEFAVLLPDTTQEQAPDAAERLLARLREPTADLRGYGVERVAASVGVVAVADLGPEDGPDELLALADRAMYRAKESGGDRACAHVANR